MYSTRATVGCKSLPLSTLFRLFSALLGAVLAVSAVAAPLRSSSTLETEAVMAVATRGGGLSQARFTLLPKTRLRKGRAWSAEGRLRIEAAVSDTGLGTRDTFSDLSEPWEVTDDVRVEIDTATLSWRQRATQLTLGKQAVAWGVLDGVQVTDRFDAVRRRESIFTRQRPERLTRWGARARFKLGDTRFDAAAALDGSVNQLANLDETYAVIAPRFRGGLPAAVVPENLSVDTPDTPTAGLRLERTFGSSDTSLMVIHGPDTEPVFRAAGLGVVLDYPTRTLLGATWQRAAGARVWRLEAAWIPRQPVNLAPATGLTTARKSRWLVGSGLDWGLPGGVFVNAQLAVDHVENDAAGLARPDTDVVATLRAQRGFRNDSWLAAVEMISALSDGDGTFRPSLTWKPRDNLGIDIGADLTWGDPRDLIGQFEDASRVYIRVRRTF